MPPERTSLVMNTIAESICVFDFCGNTYSHKGYGRWADYYPAKGVICFGGAWQFVPDMHSPTEPTEDEVIAHADYWGGVDTFDRRYLCETALALPEDSKEIADHWQTGCPLCLLPQVALCERCNLPGHAIEDCGGLS